MGWPAYICVEKRRKHFLKKAELREAIAHC